jgi:hypothetical protein
MGSFMWNKSLVAFPGITVAVSILFLNIIIIAPAIAAGVPAGEFTLQDLEIDQFEIRPDVSYIWKESTSEKVARTDGTNPFKIYCVYQEMGSKSGNWLRCTFTVNRGALDQRIAEKEIYPYFTEVRNTCAERPGYYNVEQVLDEKNKSFSVMMKTNPHPDTNIVYHNGERLFYDGGNFCHIEFSLVDKDEWSVRAIADAVQNKVYEVWAGQSSKPKGTLTITHYHPLSPEALNNPAQYPGGELIVRLVDENGRGIEGKKVYLFVEKRYEVQTVFGLQPAEVLIFDSPHNIDEAQTWPLPHFKSLKFLGGPLPNTWYGGYTVLTTDNNGVARYNYLEKGVFKYERLEKYLREDGKAYVKIGAIALDQEIPPPDLFYLYSGKTLKALAYGSITIEFDSVAAIRSIGTTNVSSEPMVRVMWTDPSSGAPAGTRSVRSGDLPCKLQPGNYVLLDPDDRVEIRWLTGHKVLAGVKPGFIDANRTLAKLYIGVKDLGWYRWIGEQASVKAVVGGIAADGVWWLIWAPEVAEVIVTGLIPSGFAGGWWVGEQWADPILIVPQSTVMFDYEGDRAKISLLEGKVSLINTKNETMKLTPWQAINVSARGEFGPVETFTEEDLSQEQRDAINEIETAQPSPPTGSPPATGEERKFPCPCGAIAVPVLLVTILFARMRKI